MRDLRQRIEREYEAGRYGAGWRFLYGPASTLHGADVAFIGLNPGGSERDPYRAEFSCEAGSAYVRESWAGHPPGEAPLQWQVRTLFDGLGEVPASVLAGNLVPFRSRDWDSLPSSERATAFGLELWRDVLRSAEPSLIVTMGGTSFDLLARLYGIAPRSVPTGWGRVSARWGEADGCRIVGLPHLSRFRIVTRPQSEVALRSLFGTRWSPGRPTASQRA